MKCLYTGYAGDRILLDYYRSCGLCPVIVSGKRVKGFCHCTDSDYCKILAPRIKWWWPWYKSQTKYNVRVAQKWYVRYYMNNVLAKLSPIVVYDELLRLGAGRPIILCCVGEQQEYLFCHRHILGQWLQAGVKDLFVTEFPHANRFLRLSA